MAPSPSLIHQTRLWIEHARADHERRKEIQREMLEQFGLRYRVLSTDPEVGVWESAIKKRRKQ